MDDFIIRDTNGDIVGKYRQMTEPNVPDNLSVEEVDDVSDYSVKSWWDEE